jgi:hypothetical protein
MFPIRSEEQLRRSAKHAKREIAASATALESGVLTEQQARVNRKLRHIWTTSLSNAEFQLKALEVQP